jgi:hypothetical protein
MPGLETGFAKRNKENVRIKVNDPKTTPGSETPAEGQPPLTTA